MSNSRTSESLLQKMQQPETREQAWLEFSEGFGPKIFRWAKSCFKNAEDAKDVAQETAFNLWKAFSNGWNYKRDGSFHCWLKTMTCNAAITEIRRRKNDPVTGGTANLKRINEVEVANDLAEMLEDEHQNEVLARAKSAVQEIVNATHWRVFELDMEGRDPGEIASLVGLTYGNVTTVLQRVKEKVRREAQRLNGEMLFEDGEMDGKPNAIESATQAVRKR